MLVDSHCHLSSEEIYSQLDLIIKRAQDVGVSYFLNAGSKFDELNKQLEICKRFKNVYTVVGVHPHDAVSYADITAEEIVEKTQDINVVAIGECGLDYFYDFAPRDVQIKVFQEMIKASQMADLPIIIHTREAEEDTMSILEKAYKEKPFAGVIHSYSSSLWLAEEAIKMGFYISASGMITFKNADQLRDSFQKIPQDKLLVETDTPYLAPVPVRGRTNEPAYVIHTARVLADLKGVSYEQLCEITTKNFFKLFKKAKKDD